MVLLRRREAMMLAHLEHLVEKTGTVPAGVGVGSANYRLLR